MRKDGTRNSSSQGLVWHLQTLPCSTAAFRWASTSCLLPGGGHMWGPTLMCLQGPCRHEPHRAVGSCRGTQCWSTQISRRLWKCKFVNGQPPAPDACVTHRAVERACACMSVSLCMGIEAGEVSSRTILRNW